LEPLLGLRDGKTCRLARFLGADRHITATIDSFGHSRQPQTKTALPNAVRDALRTWWSREHQFFGRFWGVVHLRQKEKSGLEKECVNEAKPSATHGQGLSKAEPGSVARNFESSLSDLVNSFVPLQLNLDALCKTYSRLDLAFPRTYPTIKLVGVSDP